MERNGRQTWMKEKHAMMDEISDHVVCIDDYAGIESYPKLRLTPPNGWQHQMHMKIIEFPEMRESMIREEVGDETRSEMQRCNGNSIRLELGRCFSSGQQEQFG